MISDWAMKKYGYMIEQNPNIDIEKEFGIYRIYNKFNSRMYIGMCTNNFLCRWRVHHCDLEQNKHPNKPLQFEWNRYGERYFLFEAVEVLYKKEEAREIESYWAVKMRYNYLYNNSKDMREKIFYVSEKREL